MLNRGSGAEAQGAVFSNFLMAKKKVILGLRGVQLKFAYGPSEKMI